MEKEGLRGKRVWSDPKVICAEWEGKMPQVFSYRDGDKTRGLCFKYRRE